MKRISPSIKFYADKIANDYNFCFMRWGDAEIGHVLGRMRGTDCNQHQYFPQLQTDMRHVLSQRLTNPKEFDYTMAIQNYGYEMFQTEWDGLIQSLGDIETWHDTDIFCNAVIEKKLLPFLQAVRTRNIIMVGPMFLFGRVPFKQKAWVDVPELNSYLELNRLYKDILDNAVNVDNPLVLLSCGAMTAKPLMHMLFKPIVKIKMGSIWDMGSVWDIFAGRATRGYMFKLPLDCLAGYGL
jgi:hypothetical protein